MRLYIAVDVGVEFGSLFIKSLCLKQKFIHAASASNLCVAWD